MHMTFWVISAMRTRSAAAESVLVSTRSARNSLRTNSNLFCLLNRRCLRPFRRTGLLVRKQRNQCAQRQHETADPNPHDEGVEINLNDRLFAVGRGAREVDVQVFLHVGVNSDLARRLLARFVKAF